VAAGAGDRVDHLGARRLALGETWFWYVVAAITYIGASIAHKSLLNWIVGPAWLVLVVWLGPALADRLRRERR
jgi:hypothetical protein